MYAALKILAVGIPYADWSKIEKGFATLAQSVVIVQTKDLAIAMVKMSNDTNVDLILIGLEFPSAAACEAALVLEKAYPHIPIAVLSDRTEQSAVLTALQNRAAGYLLRSTLPAEISRAGKVLLEGGTYLPAQESLIDDLATAAVQESLDLQARRYRLARRAK